MLKSFTNLKKENFSINSASLINLALGFFPISFILGNFVINLNIIVFCILGIVILKSKILTTKFNFPIKIIFLLFLVILLSTGLSFIISLYHEDYNQVNLERLIKAVLFFRYFLMLLIVYLLNKENILNYKYLYFSAIFATITVSLDIIYQFIFGFNIVGIASYGHHNSGFFGDELIAGGFIQRFSFFSIIFTVLILNSRKSNSFILTTILILILGIGIILSGNRMPLIFFLLGLILIFLINSNFRKIISAGILCVLLTFQLFVLHDPYVKDSYDSLYSNVKNILTGSKSTSNNIENSIDAIKEENKQESKKGFLNDFVHHNRLILSAIDVWKKNKILGNGIKSFRLDCHKLQTHAIEPLDGYNLTEEFVKNKKNRLCSNHPHNYYFEILAETGIIGFFITLIIAGLFIIFIFKNFKLLKGNTAESFLLLASTISLFLEVFPIKSTGSIFSTFNITYIILISSIILSYKKNIVIKDES